MSTRFEGYLFSKLQNIGTRSEGPQYFLQHWDYREVPIVKNATLWQQDPQLHALLGRKVACSGTLEEDGLHYTDIQDLKP